MDAKVKALILGISIKWFPKANEIGKFQDDTRSERLTEALGRLEIDVDHLEPDTLSSMLDAEEVVEWLAENPHSTVSLGYWEVVVTGQKNEWNKHDWPFNLNGAVEDFDKDCVQGKWTFHWCLG